MIRYLKYILLALLTVVLLTVALANRGAVTLHLLPENMGTFMGENWTVELPLFLVIYGGIVAGLLIGFVWEWFREQKHRSTAAARSREVARLEKEVTKLRDSSSKPADEVLALLQDKRKAS